MRILPGKAIFILRPDEQLFVRLSYLMIETLTKRPRTAGFIQVDNQGLGPIGQCVVRWAKLKGAKRVIGIDNVPERLAFAAEKSGVEIVDFNQHKDVVRRLQELVPGGLNVAIDCGVCGKEYLLFLKLLKLVFDRNVPPTEDSSTQDAKELYA